MGLDLRTRLDALLVVAARLARATSSADAVRIATVEGAHAIGGRGGTFADAVPAAREGRTKTGASSAGYLLTVPVRSKEAPTGALSVEFASEAEESARSLVASLADLLAAALDRQAHVAALVRELGHAGEMQRFLAQAGEALALSLDDRTTLDVLARLAVPRVCDWCIIDVAARDEGMTRSAVMHGVEEDSTLAATLSAAPPPRGAIGRDPRELLASELTPAADLPPDLVAVAEAIGARSAIIVYALGVSGGAARVALFTARSERRLGFDEFSMAEELARLTSQALERASLYAEAQRANEAKDVFLATVSHELRGPLAAISMWTHVLGLAACDESTRARAVQAIEESARSQGRLIEDMIDLSRLVTGKLRLVLSPVSVVGVVRSVIEAMAASAQAKGVEIVFRSEGDAHLSADEPRLRQVFSNVISNAIEFCPAGRSVDVSVARMPEGIRVRVRDEGEGISASFLPHVFEPFHQEDASLTRLRGGLGLGLAVAWRIIDLHGGVMSAESPGRGQGATFSVELPLSSPA